MSVLLIPKPTTSQPISDEIPALVNGDHLTGAEFMRRYEAMPDVKAELINGVVHLMASPVRTDRHSQPLYNLITWLGLYRSRHPELIGGADGTVILADGQRYQPDAFLFKPNGTARLGADGYVHGAPELVCEIAASTVSVDANEKADAYAAAGVAEYLLWRTEETPAWTGSR